MLWVGKGYLQNRRSEVQITPAKPSRITGSLTSPSIFSVAFSSDGNRLVTGSSDSTIKVWNVSPGANAGEQPLTLYGGSTAVLSAQFSPDGKRIVAGWSYRGTPGSVRVLALDLEDLLAIANSRVTRALTNDECQKYLHVDKCL